MSKQLECRIVITFRSNGYVAVSLCDPLRGRVEPPVVCGPLRRDVDRVIQDLKGSIQQAGHRLTFCERSE